MKRIISVVLAISVLLCSISITAYAMPIGVTSGKCGDNATWEFVGDTITISGTGKIYDYGYSKSASTNWAEVYDHPWSDVADYAKTLVIEEGITEIGKYNFSKMTALKNVEFPSTLKKVGAYAFGLCDNLERVDALRLEQWCNIEFVTSSSNPLMYAHNLCINGELIGDALVVPEIKEIKNYTFANMVNLKSIAIPDTVEAIGTGAFYNCYNVTNIAFSNSLKQIYPVAFENCFGLTELNLPNSLVEIGSGAFLECNGLTEVRIPNSVKYIRGDAFSECLNLTKVYLGYGISRIEGAFQKCEDCNNKNPITDVYYYGDEDSLSKVYIDTYDEQLLSANWHFLHSHTYSVAEFVNEDGNPHTGYRIYRCDCGLEYKEIFRLPNKFTFKEYKNGNFYYDCEVCDHVDYFEKATIKKLWTNHCNGVQINPALMYDETCLDLNDDGVINAKDYAKIQHLIKYGY